MLIVLIVLLVAMLREPVVPELAQRRDVRLTQSASADAIDLTAVERMAVSPNSRSIAWTSSDERAAVLAVVFEQGGRKETLAFEESSLEQFLPGSAIVDLAWSSDGAVLAVELAAGDTAGTILLIEPARGKTARVVSLNDDANFALPRWAATGHTLYFVPAGAASSEGGIIRLEVDSRRHSRMVDDLWVTDFTVRDKEITALVTDLDVKGSAHHDRFIRVDLRSGRSETVISRTSAEEAPPTPGLQL